MRFLTAVVLLLSQSVVFAQDKKIPTAKKLCVVISGSKNDFNGALSNKLFSQGGKVGSHDCVVKNSWSEAKAYVQANLLKGSPLLLIQAAHGSKDGAYHLNSGWYPKEKVLKDVNELSRDYQVGAVINSCFSGDLIKDKILEDDAAGKASDKLCLMTSASFGRISYDVANDMVDRLSTSPAGTDLNSLYLDNRAGLTSAAAWNEIGLPGYFRTKVLKDGLTTITAADSIARFDGQCRDLGQASSALCASPVITNEMFRMLSNFGSPIIQDDIKYYFVTNTQSSADRLKKKATESPEKAQILLAGSRCYQGLHDYFIAEYQDKLVRLNYYSELRHAVSRFKELKVNKDCETYAASLPADADKERVYLNDFQIELRDYEENVAKLSKMFSKRTFDQDFDFKEFAKAASEEKKQCRPEDKADIIRSMFGEEFFADEYKGEWDPENNNSGPMPDEGLYGRKMSTQFALKGFQNGSIRRNKPANEIDRARAKACKDFKL